jgi:hypothetical protein
VQRLGELLDDLVDFAEEHPEGSAIEGGRRLRGKKSLDTAILKALTAEGIGVDLQHIDDGGPVIIGAKPFGVPPELINLFKILCDDRPGTGQNGLVAWKSRAQVLAQLQKRSADNAARITGKTISSKVHQLRNLLSIHFINPYFVQTDRKLGIRFARRIVDREHAAPLIGPVQQPCVSGAAQAIGGNPN